MNNMIMIKHNNNSHTITLNNTTRTMITISNKLITKMAVIMNNNMIKELMITIILDSSMIIISKINNMLISNGKIKKIIKNMLIQPKNNGMTIRKYKGTSAKMATLLLESIETV